MKVHERSEKELSLLLHRGEALLLLGAFHEYPMMPNEKRSLARKEDYPQLVEAEEFLRSSIREHEEGNRGRLRTWLGAGWVPHQTDVLLRIALEDRDWILQVLNDLHVGSWHELGCPDFEEQKRILSRTKPGSDEFRRLFTLFLTMEMQALLLDASLSSS